MAAPPVSEMPVLHATSLATQGQGWGSYQSLSSHSCSNSAPSEDQRSIGAARRRKLSALSVDVDAATRALVGVMIKSNGLVTEAATFAKWVWTSEIRLPTATPVKSMILPDHLLSDRFAPGLVYCAADYIHYALGRALWISNNMLRKCVLG